MVALDVWENEPGVDPELARRVWLGTPHIAGYSLEGKLRGTAMIHQALCHALYLSAETSLENALPESPPLGIEADDRLEALILAAYDPSADHARFRDSLNGDASERAQAFDQLRRNYPVRYEFSRRPPAQPVGKEAAAQLRAAGFMQAQE